MTKKLYLFPDAPLTCEGRIINIEPGDIPRVRIDQTIFHAKGGGQLPDSGLLDGATVLDVRHAPDGEVDHFVSSISGLRIGATVKQEVAADSRTLNSQLHSAGHTIAN